MEQLELNLKIRKIEGPDYDSDGNPLMPYLPGKYTSGDTTWEYKKYSDFYKSNQTASSVMEDKSYLEWYEKWKGDNFNNTDDPIDKDRKRYGG